MSDTQDQFDVWVDFNDLDNGTVVALTEHASRPITVGDTVRVGDYDGHRAQATVLWLRSAQMGLRLTSAVERTDTP